MDTAVSAPLGTVIDLPTGRRPAVLIIGRGTDWRRRLEDRLQQAGCDVMTASNANQGVDQAVAVGPDVVMLGHDLPDTDSFEVCRRIRSRLRPHQQPAFLLTPHDGVGTHWQAADCQNSRVDRLDATWQLDPGVEIFLASHASPSIAETRAPDRDLIRWGPLSLNAGRHFATADGRDLALTPTEFRILWTLVEHPGHVFDRDQLSELCRIRGRSGQKRTVDVHIKSIRQKLRNHAELIETVYGVGYRFRDTDPAIQ